MNDDWTGCIIYAVLIAIILGVGLVCELPNRVTDEVAISRFAEQAKVEVSDITVIRHSNNRQPFGDLHDVTYEMEINDEMATGRCTSGWLYTSPMICRLYWGSGAE